MIESTDVLYVALGQQRWQPNQFFYRPVHPLFKPHFLWVLRPLSGSFLFCAGGILFLTETSVGNLLGEKNARRAGVSANTAILLSAVAAGFFRFVLLHLPSTLLF